MFPKDTVQDILGKKAERGWYNISKSTHFRVEATGHLTHSPTRHTIVALFEKQASKGKTLLLTRYWNDNYVEVRGY